MTLIRSRPKAVWSPAAGVALANEPSSATRIEGRARSGLRRRSRRSDQLRVRQASRRTRSGSWTGSSTGLAGLKPASARTMQFTSAGSRHCPAGRRWRPGTTAGSRCRRPRSPTPPCSRWTPTPVSGEGVRVTGALSATSRLAVRSPADQRCERHVDLAGRTRQHQVFGARVVEDRERPGVGAGERMAPRSSAGCRQRWRCRCVCSALVLPTCRGDERRTARGEADGRCRADGTADAVQVHDHRVVEPGVVHDQGRVPVTRAPRAEGDAGRAGGAGAQGQTHAGGRCQGEVGRVGSGHRRRVDGQRGQTGVGVGHRLGAGRAAHRGRGEVEGRRPTARAGRAACPSR